MRLFGTFLAPFAGLFLLIQATHSGPVDMNSIYQGGSCRERGLCCSGRDRSCAVPLNGASAVASPAMGGILGNLITPSEHCYCDSVCLTLGDCCLDYKDTCGVIDCQTSRWGEWSECDATCGVGTMSRSRSIVSPAANGGKDCPDLHQKRACHGQQCSVADNDKLLRETAIILQSTFSATRQVNEDQDIRRNLRLINSKGQQENVNEYVALYEVVSPGKRACELSGAEIVKTLSKGARVCVQCQEAAMRGHLGYRCHGHGVVGKTTRWTTVANMGCHGRWTRLDDRDAASYCNNATLTAGQQLDFIFI